MAKAHSPTPAWSRESAKPAGESPLRSSPAHVNAILPDESFGACRRADVCGSWRVWLANGWCVKHWDDGVGTTKKRKTKRNQSGILA
jgi:hypothetical protein